MKYFSLVEFHDIDKFLLLLYNICKSWYSTKIWRKYDYIFCWSFICY